MDKKLLIYTTKSRKQTTYTRDELTYTELLDRLKTFTVTAETFEQYKAMTTDQKNDVKDVGGFVGGVLEGGKRGAATILTRSLLVLDIDVKEKGKYTAASITTKVEEHFRAEEFFIYSSHSHEADAPRLRLVFPLEKPVSPSQYRALAYNVSAYIGSEIFDQTDLQPERLMYYPSRSVDGEEYTYRNEGKWLDGLRADLQQMTPEMKRREKVYSEIVRAENPLEKSGDVGVFCRAYDIHTAIEKFLPERYTEAGEGRYTYVQGSTAGGAVVYDDVFLYSYHSSDPCSTQLVNAFDLVRIHKFGQSDSGNEKDITKTESFKKMIELVRNDKVCSAQLNNDAFMSCKEDFEDEFEDIGDQAAEAEKPSYEISDAFFGKHGFIPMRLQAAITSIVPVQCVRDQLYVYEKGVYKADYTRRLLRMCANIIGERFRSAHGTETLDVMRTMCTADESFLNNPSKDKINVLNGLIDVKTGKLEPHSKDFISFTQLPIVYDEAATCPTIEKFISDVVPADSVNLIYEFFGLCMLPITMNKALFLLGEGKNGKSTMIDLLSRFVGEDNVSNISLQDLSGNRFKLAGMQNKLVNAYADLPSESLKEVDIFKAIVTGDKVNAENKNQTPFNFRPYAKQIFGMNAMPKTSDFSNGFTRRLAIIEFNRPVANPDFMLLDRMTTPEELSGLLNKALEGLNRLLERGGFEDNDSTKRALADYVQMNDPMEAFIEAACERGDGKEYLVKVADFTAAYTKFLEEQKHNLYNVSFAEIARILKAKGIKKKRPYFDGVRSKEEYFEGVRLAITTDFDDEDLLA